MPTTDKIKTAFNNKSVLFRKAVVAGVAVVALAAVYVIASAAKPQEGDLIVVEGDVHIDTTPDTTN